MKAIQYERKNIRRVRKERPTRAPLLLAIGGCVLSAVAAVLLWLKHVQLW